MTEAQIIETCPRCDTIIEEDTSEWYEAHDDEFDYDHQVYEAWLDSKTTHPTLCGNWRSEDAQPSLEEWEDHLATAQVVDTCPTCGNIVED